MNARVVQFIVRWADGRPRALLMLEGGTPLVYDDPDRPVGIVESLLPEARGSRPESEGRSLLGVARLDDSPEGDLAWRAIRGGGVTGIQLNIGDWRSEDGQLVRGRALHAVRLVPLDDTPSPETRVVSTWEEPCR